MSDEPYKTGYKKPPVQHRFRKGEGGNRKGRPRGSLNLKHDVQHVLGALLTVTSEGRQRKMSRQVAILEMLVIKALNGDDAASERAIALAREFSSNQDEERDEPLTQDDAAILRAYRRRGLPDE